MHWTKNKGKFAGLATIVWPKVADIDMNGIEEVKNTEPGDSREVMVGGL